MTAGETTQGRRLSDVKRGELPNPWPERGDYWREVDEGGSHIDWWIVAPRESRPVPSRISLHTVTEHEDGSITASPSILVNFGGNTSWHGYLERGVWREV